MKLSRKLNCVCMVLFFCSILVIPCLAEPSDIRIPVQISDIARTHMCIADNLLATYVSGSSPQAIRVYNPDMTLFRSVSLTNNTMDIESLEISEGRVYYAEYDTAELWTSRTKTVYEYDMSAGNKRIIYSTGFYNNIESRVTDIAADGDHVVLREDCGDNELTLHTLSTGTNKMIFRTADMIQGLAISGDRIVWGCDRTDREPGREIHVYTISTGEDDIIPESMSIRTWGLSDISGDNVVWSRSAEEPDTSRGYPALVTAGGEIMLTNLSTGMTRSLETFDAPSAPYISGNTVVYVKKTEVDYDNPNTGTIRVYDIGTATFSDIASEVAGVTDFDNGLVIWHRYSPRSDWLTSISGTMPTATSPAPTETTTQASPANPFAAIVALTIGIAGYAAIHRRE